ncbi:MAG: hypothetical protein EXR51_10040 [Dehalococcoidia bacterium]|nr:hypothetical protein [Dehalococcoidia bacterium]
MSTGIEQQPSIDFLMLADRAEVLNGKLYVMGGAWDRLQRANFDEPADIFVTLGILVPWHATNQEYGLTIEIDHEDGTRLAEIKAGFVTGRSPDAIPGQSFRTIVALGGKFKLPGPGAYKVTGGLSSGDTKSVAFYVKQLPAAPAAA